MTDSLSETNKQATVTDFFGNVSNFKLLKDEIYRSVQIPVTIVHTNRESYYEIIDQRLIPQLTFQVTTVLSSRFSNGS